MSNACLADTFDTLDVFEVSGFCGVFIHGLFPVVQVALEVGLSSKPRPTPHQRIRILGISNPTYEGVDS
jgi:hypothetical protein